MSRFAAPLHFASLAAVRAYVPVGCHSGDSAAFLAVDAFAADLSHSVADRAEALRISGRVWMGLDPVENLEHLSDADLLAAWAEQR